MEVLEFSEEERREFYGDTYGINRSMRERPWRALKRAANHKVAKQIELGKIVRGCCEVCGEANAQAHHDDYLKPLQIRWLCIKHHFEHHQKNGFQHSPLH